MLEQREKAKGRGGATGGVSREMRVRREEGEVRRKGKYPSVRPNGSQTGKATYGEVAALLHTASERFEHVSICCCLLAG